MNPGERVPVQYSCTSGYSLQHEVLFLYYTSHVSVNIHVLQLIGNRHVFVYFWQSPLTFMSATHIRIHDPKGLTRLARFIACMLCISKVGSTRFVLSLVHIIICFLQSVLCYYKIRLSMVLRFSLKGQSSSHTDVSYLRNSTGLNAHSSTQTIKRNSLQHTTLN